MIGSGSIIFSSTISSNISLFIFLPEIKIAELFESLK
jgi:hypothetical protein